MPAAISVLLPVRDAAPYLPECIASLRAQTFEDFEVLAVDDGSTDEGPRLLSAWATEDSRVNLVRPGARGNRTRTRGSSGSRTRPLSGAHGRR